MGITLLGFIGIVVFAILGYFRGMYRILAAFISFFLAAIFAKTFSFLILWPVSRCGFIPKSLVPLAGQFIAGIILFILFYFVAGCFIRIREQGRVKLKQPRMSDWEHAGGSILGAAWGLFLVVLILTGLHLIGNVEEALVQPISAEGGRTSTKTKKAPEDNFVTARNQIDKSLFGVIVKKTDPMDVRIKEIFSDLTTVVSDPTLYKEFQNHPDIARFTNDPRIRALSEDKEIQGLLQEKRYFELLDNQKIASLVKDEGLSRELKNVDLGKILKEVMEKSSGMVQ